MPALVNEALAAHDRAKDWMTLLQSARQHADHPHGATINLRQERIACGVIDDNLDTGVEGSRREAPIYTSFPRSAVSMPIW